MEGARHGALHGEQGPDGGLPPSARVAREAQPSARHAREGREAAVEAAGQDRGRRLYGKIAAAVQGLWVGPQTEDRGDEEEPDRAKPAALQRRQGRAQGLPGHPRRPAAAVPRVAKGAARPDPRHAKGGQEGRGGHQGLCGGEEEDGRADARAGEGVARSEGGDDGGTRREGDTAQGRDCGGQGGGQDGAHRARGEETSGGGGDPQPQDEARDGECGHEQGAGEDESHQAQ
mmetsp:Transcript_4450/g.11721  ORF Transcript_4450/g.11721 Transcript_4450/m.11721 type:complete len:231 (+) Transcript_4450:251-943(+)